MRNAGEFEKSRTFLATPEDSSSTAPSIFTNVRHKISSTRSSARSRTRTDTTGSSLRSSNSPGSQRDRAITLIPILPQPTERDGYLVSDTSLLICSTASAVTRAHYIRARDGNETRLMARPVNSAEPQFGPICYLLKDV